MKITTILKYASLATLVLGVAVGCSSTSQETACSPQQAKDAIAAAKAANKRAKSVDNEWRDTAKIIAQAEKAQADGKCEEAVKLANKARNQAENAVAQAEKDKQPVVANEKPAPTSNVGSYSVVKGDNLWNIAAKPSIYNNPFEWPLIYKANSGKIKDADLIYPGQVFAINANPSSADVAAAVHHAKSRGAWSLGTVEASDKAYLAQ
ncbi:MAG: LysM peptidoglycan-binding domain-containing protein [Gammaproteobacteria bacterium]